MARIYAKANKPPRVVVRRSPPKKARRMAPLAPCGICGGAIYFEVASGSPLSLCLDHTWPKERYPLLRDEAWNLQPAHKICNERKAQRDPTLIEALRAQSRRGPAQPRRVTRRRPTRLQRALSS
jgi:hypothetical protein